MRKVSITLTIPPDLRRWLEAEAARHTRSVSQQVEHMLLQQRRSDDTAVKQPEAA